RLESRTNSAVKIRLLPGRKAPTFVELVVIEEFVIRARCPTPGGFIEVVIWIDHQQCSVHQNRKSDLLNASVRRHSGLLCRRGECRRILPDELLQAQRRLPR